MKRAALSRRAGTWLLSASLAAKLVSKTHIYNFHNIQAPVWDVGQVQHWPYGQGFHFLKNNQGAMFGQSDRPLPANDGAAGLAAPSTQSDLGGQT